MGLFDFLNKPKIPNEIDNIRKAIQLKLQESNNDIHYLALYKSIENAVDMETDLVEATITGYHCAECSKYIMRVYSLSGTDKRFPKFPQYLIDNTKHCGITLYSYMHGVSIMSDAYNNLARVTGNEVIKISNRPYTDCRTQEYIDGYEQLQIKRQQERINQINSEQAKKEYEQIVFKLPDIAPKNQSSYFRMKKTNSKNYQLIIEKAIEKGIEILELQ